MRLLEHQSKKLLKRFGLKFTESDVVDSPQTAAEAATRISLPVVLKAQVPFGGRGKAGAVKTADTAEQAYAAGQALLDMQLRGYVVKQITVEPKITFQREVYVGVTWDVIARLPVAIVNPHGGVNVEQTDCHDVQRCTFNPTTGLYAYQGREMAGKAGIEGKAGAVVGQVLAQLSQAAIALDAVTVEINPLVETTEGAWLGLDARLEIDDDALGRQHHHIDSLGVLPNTSAGRPPTELEQQAQRIDAMDHRGVAGRVVEFDGDMALLIGGGGASLTVFDAVKRHGGRPANYCEVGGNPTEEKVAALTALLLSKPGVQKLAVIMNVVNNTRADVMARGVIEGIIQTGQKPSDVISLFRIPGSWEPEAKQILANVGVEALGREVSLDAAAKLAVQRSCQHVA